MTTNVPSDARQGGVASAPSQYRCAAKRRMRPGPSGWLIAASLLALLARGLAADEVECPAGTERIHTDNPYEPFKCAPKGNRRKGGLSSGFGPVGFAVKLRCPQGSRPVMTPGALQPYRCVTSSWTAADPDLAPDLDAQGRARSWKAWPEPVAAGRAAAPPREAGRVGAKSYTRYAITGEVSFDYPRDWHLTDAWKDEPPTIYVVHDTASGGKQVSMTLIAAKPEQAGYQSMELSILKEKEWQNAVQEKGEGRVAGLRARFVSVTGTSRSAYLDRGDGRYLTINYSAPADRYEAYLPAFQRLLKSLRVISP